MNFTCELSRDKFITASARFKEIFPDACGIIDAEYLSADRSRVIGISNLPIFAPICNFILGSKDVLDYIDTISGDIHIVYGDVITANGNAVPAVVDAIIRGVIDTAIKGVGSLNEKGEHVIDLKGGFVGPHYTVNLLLGCRIGFESPMISTPKAALDAFGRGAFRAAADTQVLASRCVMNPEEAGEPANRQFYLTENNEQIFYSADVKNNAKTAVCYHKPNHTVIEYETECGLKITRTIFILPQYAGLPEAVEAQIVKITNLTDKKRDIRIVMTGVLAVVDSQTVVNDIIIQILIYG